MGAYDQIDDQSQERGDRSREGSGKRRRGTPDDSQEPMGGSERSVPRERRERTSGQGADSDRESGSEFDERAQRRFQQRMRAAESGRDDGDWS